MFYLIFHGGIHVLIQYAFNSDYYVYDCYNHASAVSSSSQQRCFIHDVIRQVVPRAPVAAPGHIPAHAERHRGLLSAANERQRLRPTDAVGAGARLGQTLPVRALQRVLLVLMACRIHSQRGVMSMGRTNVFGTVTDFVKYFSASPVISGDSGALRPTTHVIR